MAIPAGALRAALRAAEAQLFALPNVRGVGLGRKQGRGRPAGDVCVRVYVALKVPAPELEPADRVPTILHAADQTIPTDVAEIGEPLIQSFAGRVRPVLPGYSVGNLRITAGTVGGFLRGPAGEHYLLSNNHVLADEDRAENGSVVVQPGPADGGRDPADRIGVLTWAHPLNREGENDADVALARLDDGIGGANDYGGIGPVSRTGSLRLGAQVRKVGRTTGLTHGEITDRDVTIDVWFDTGILRFRGQALATAMSQPGDSGSVIVDSKARAVALLFAGSTLATVVTPMAQVQRVISASAPGPLSWA